MQVQVRGQCILKIAGNVLRGSAAARNLESIRRENGFALMFVQSCHGWVVYIVATDPRKQATIHQSA